MTARPEWAVANKDGTVIPNRNPSRCVARQMSTRLVQPWATRHLRTSNVASPIGTADNQSTHTRWNPSSAAQLRIPAHWALSKWYPAMTTPIIIGAALLSSPPTGTCDGIRRHGLFLTHDAMVGFPLNWGHAQVYKGSQIPGRPPDSLTSLLSQSHTTSLTTQHGLVL